MRKQWYILVILAAALLSACGPVATALPSPAPSQPPSLPTATRMAAVKMECEFVSIDPTPGPTDISMFPPVSSKDWVRGSKDAVMTIIEYSDFQCPYCGLLAADLHTFLEKHPDDVRVVYRHFPLPGHPLALPAAAAAEAAGLQGKFWEMHDALFAEQASFASMTDAQFQDWLMDQAVALELDLEKFTQDMQSEAILSQVKQAQQYGMSIGIPGTPFLLINGEVYPGPRDVANFEGLLNMERLSQRLVTGCPPMVIDPQKEYIATLKTEKGDVKIQLFADQAPMAVNSFVYLAQQGWYDDITFHFVDQANLVMSGDPSGTGYGGPGFNYRAEINGLKFDHPGVVAMFNTGAGLNGSVFFIKFRADPESDNRFTIFGEVIDGMDVLKKLDQAVPSPQGNVPPGDKLFTVEIQEK